MIAWIFDTEYYRDPKWEVLLLREIESKYHTEPSNDFIYFENSNVELGDLLDKFNELEHELGLDDYYEIS